MVEAHFGVQREDAGLGAGNLLIINGAVKLNNSFHHSEYSLSRKCAKGNDEFSIRSLLLDYINYIAAVYNVLITHIESALRVRLHCSKI